MNWIKENKSLAAVFGIMIVGAIALGVVLFLSNSTYSTKKADWETATASLNRLEIQKLYPNAANAREKEAKVTAYANEVNLLRDALLLPSVQQPVKPISETEFQAKLKERVTAVKRAAAAADILLPSEFALGFEDYTGSLPRSPEVAADLSLHLDVLEKLTSVLIDSGVRSIDSFIRLPLPNEKADPVPTGPAASSTTPRGGAKKKPLITEAAAAEPVLDRYTTKIMLTTDQAPFQAVLNTLSDPAKTPHFLVVRLLRVENEQSESPLKEEVRSQTRNLETSSVDAASAVSALSEDPNAATTGKTIVPPAPLPVDAVTIMGNEMLKVYLEVDYIRFRPVADKTGETTTAVANP